MAKIAAKHLMVVPRAGFEPARAEAQLILSLMGSVPPYISSFRWVHPTPWTLVEKYHYVVSSAAQKNSMRIAKKSVLFRLNADDPIKAHRKFSPLDNLGIK